MATRIEIVTPPENYSPEIDRHSLMNAVNACHSTLLKLEECYPGLGFKERAGDVIALLVSLDIEDHQSIRQARNTFRQLEQFLRDLDSVPGPLRKHLDALQAALAVVDVRLTEFLDDRLAWREQSTQGITEMLQQFLSATERLSQGKFRIVYPPKHSNLDPSAYCVDIRIPKEQKTVVAPMVVNDILRDLLANARKYSAPNSTIQVSLETVEDGGLRICVEDEGRGIPREELQRVVDMGYRASNALDRPTMGAGFGLTKAYSLCKKFNGRFFIESEPGRGTKIEMTLFPQPPRISARQNGK